MRITVEEHLAWILAAIEPLPEREVPVRDAYGLTLAETVRARYALPLWHNSAMDGYALRSADVAAASDATPVELRVIGEVAAGSAADPAIAPGSAVRIMTGAPVPSDADTVVPVESTRGERPENPWADRTVRVLVPAPAGANIRRRGEDVAEGGVIARTGQSLGAARLAALAAAGADRVVVRERPRVAVLATGSELRGAGEELERGQIPESNSLLIAGLLRELGIEPVEVRRSADDAASLAQQLRDLGSHCDVIVTTGGVGPGRHDVVRIALEAEPGVRAVRVAVRPGQPQCAGRLSSGAFVFALPGNPVSAAVSFELFVRPALLAVQGRSEVHRLRLPARAAAPWRGAVGRLQVLPVVVTEDAAGLLCAPAVDPSGVSHAVGGHGGANGYALVAADRGDVAAGETVSVILVAS
ncbi:molybdopterin molybdotransferase MoeA [Leucobacter celer]|uniref:molybdopterin molybdotransferase MoeA n=1 Tax=Leucobacter celer TaxID=668625 RepID=UPI0006A7A286|nr:gephyrin-like molybdotransferase Glp [Leucobacter celer]